MALTQIGDLMLAGKPYMLVRTGQENTGPRAWQEAGPTGAEINGQYRDVARGEIGQEVRVQWKTKHKGFGEPIRQVEGRDYWGRNIDKRYPQQTTLARAINSLTPGVTAGADPSDAVEFGANIYVCYGRYVLKIDPSSDTISTAYDAGVGKVCTSLAVFKGRMYLALGEADTFRHSTDGTTWTAHAGGATYTATHFRVAEDKLYRVWKGTSGTVAAFLTNNSQDPTTTLNWGAEDAIGDTSVPVTKLANSAYQIFVAKQDGLYAADIETGRFPSLTPELAPWKSANNGIGTHVWGGLCFMPTIRGLKMFFAGSLYSAGPEAMSQNDSEIKGRFTALAGDANWLFGALYNGTDTYVLAGRSPRPDDGYPGEFTWNAVWYLAGGPYTSMQISGLTADPRLWLSRQGNISYIKLGTSLDNPLQDSTAVYQATGTDYYPAHDAGSPAVDKHFLELRVNTDNLSQVVGRYITWHYRLDDTAAWTRLGVTNQSPTQVLKFDQANDVVGRRIALKAEWTRGSVTTATPNIRNVEVLAVEYPSNRKVITANLLCSDKLKLRSGMDSRSAADIVTDLEALVTARKKVEMVDPLGRKSLVLPLGPVLTKEIMQNDTREPTMLVMAQFLKVD